MASALTGAVFSVTLSWKNLLYHLLLFKAAKSWRFLFEDKRKSSTAAIIYEISERNSRFG